MGALTLPVRTRSLKIRPALARSPYSSQQMRGTPPHHRRGPGGALRSRIDVAKFTLVGADHPGRLADESAARPIRHSGAAQFLTEAELELIVNRGARVSQHRHTAERRNEIARRARGTPRIAGRLLRRVRDFASVADAKRSTARSPNCARRARSRCRRPRRHGPPLSFNHRGPLRRRPGRRRDARRRPLPSRATPSRTSSSLYLIQCGFLQRTPRGRLITAHAFRHFGLPEPARDPAQFGLFGGDDV